MSDEQVLTTVETDDGEVQIYEGEPDANLPRSVGDAQDDLPEVTEETSARLAAVDSVFNVSEMVDWYRHHETTAELGYNPDGMCLKIAHEASNAPALYPSAFAAQHATPAKFQVHAVADLRRGMKLYFDDPADNNPFGHVTSMMGRVKGAHPGDLSGVLVRTNSVLAGRIVVVRGTYFKLHWGDDYQFGATWLNGVELDLNWTDAVKPKPHPQPRQPAIKAIRQAIADLQHQLNQVKGTGHPRVVNALERDIATLRKSIKDLA